MRPAMPCLDCNEGVRCGCRNVSTESPLQSVLRAGDTLTEVNGCGLLGKQDWYSCIGAASVPFPAEHNSTSNKHIAAGDSSGRMLAKQAGYCIPAAMLPGAAACAATMPQHLSDQQCGPHNLCFTDAHQRSPLPAQEAAALSFATSVISRCLRAKDAAAFPACSSNQQCSQVCTA